MKLQLPDVTLVLIETRQHELGRMALEECLRRCDFGDVVVFSDRAVGPARHIRVPDWSSKLGWSQCFWYDVAPHMTTSHVLGIQWDSWVVDTTEWTNEFLRWDYIGAPWWYKDGLNVGNGGFCLRSTALLRYVRKHWDRYPCITDLDDDLYCRKYRTKLEIDGFQWAPEALASRFAFETTRPSPESRHFGFHAAYNFNFGCGDDKEGLLARARLMKSSAYMTESNKYIWEGFQKAMPEVAEAASA